MDDLIKRPQSQIMLACPAPRYLYLTYFIPSIESDHKAEQAASITPDCSACFSKTLITSCRPFSSVTIFAFPSLTDKLQRAPQQFPAIAELLGNALRAAKMSCTPPSLPMTSAATSFEKKELKISKLQKKQRWMQKSILQGGQRCLLVELYTLVEYNRS